MTVPSEDVPSVTVNELPQNLAAPGITLLDVREDDEWDAGHSPDALHIPLGDLPSRLRELDPETTVYVVCRRGGRALRATAWLNQNGIDAVNVAGGMTALAEAGRQLDSKSGTPTVI